MISLYISRYAFVCTKPKYSQLLGLAQQQQSNLLRIAPDTLHLIKSIPEQYP